MEAELEQLLQEKAVLEQELRRLEGQQKELETRAKSLCQKIIQELKNKSNAKKTIVSQLQSKVEELEAQLEKFSAHAFIARAEAEAAADESKNQEDNVVILTAFDQEEVAENSATQ